MSEPLPGLGVYRAIAAVQEELAKEGIAKDRRNDQQGFKFRGIDDVYNALATLLARHQLCILPRVTKRETYDRETKGGGRIYYVIVCVEYELVCAADGSRHTAVTFGEAMDSGDKATNKAMSAAYKYLCLQTFCIPTQGDNDADATTHEVRPPNPKPTAPPPAKTAAAAPAKPAGQGLPRNGAELVTRLEQFEHTLAEEGLCESGELLAALQTAAKPRKLPSDLRQWQTADIEWAVTFARGWGGQRRKDAQAVSQ